MPYPYITQTELESHVGPEIVRRCLDDDNIGGPDGDAVTRLLASASAKVAGYLRGVYSLAAVAANTPEEVKRLALDVAEAYLAKRHPEVVKKDWEPLLKQVEKELKALRNAETRLDVEGTPEPPINVGGASEPGDSVSSGACYEPFFLNGTGDF